MALRFVNVDTCTSTMNFAAELSEDESPHGTVVNARCQTAGRGQRGNGWESEPGENLTFSIVLRPVGLPAHRQFELSMAVCTALCRVLRRVLPDHDIRIKWPNDIYAGDGKMAGILIENVIGGGARLTRSIAGLGINVNQTVFRSDAPNPVSMAQLSGRRHRQTPLLEDICKSVIELVDRLPDNEGMLLREYHSLLWRNDGIPHRWLDTRSLLMFDAAIDHVDPTGPLVLRLADGSLHSFLFKQVAAVLG